LTLSAEIQAAPHDSDVLARFPQVGTLKKAVTAEVRLPKLLALLLEEKLLFHPHPHPMTVHFPIVFFLCNPFFTILTFSLEKAVLRPAPFIA
jgi:hypothetical protein